MGTLKCKDNNAYLEEDSLLDVYVNVESVDKLLYILEKEGYSARVIDRGVIK